MVKNAIFSFFSLFRIEQKISQNFTLKISSERFEKTFYYLFWRKIKILFFLILNYKETLISNFLVHI